jgi:cytochrome P450
VPAKSRNESLRVVEAFIEPYITQALSMTPSELEQKPSKSDTFVHALARFTRSRKVIHDQLMAILLAGRDTTASGLSWAFLELARNPRVVQKLRTEIADNLGSSGRQPNYQDIKDMKYLTSIINETLRLYPVVPYNVRHSLVDTTLPHGAGPNGLDPVGVNANTAVGYSTLMMHRRRDLYPPISETFPYDPADWVPERWATWTPKSIQRGPANLHWAELWYVDLRYDCFGRMADKSNSNDRDGLRLDPILPDI